MKLIQNFGLSLNLSVSDFTSTGMGDLIGIAMGVSAGVGDVSDFYDSEITTFTAETFWNDWFCSPYNGASIVNLNPEFASLSDNRLTRVADGFGTVRFELNGVRTERKYNTFANVGATITALNGYREETVARELFDAVANHADSNMTKRELPYFSVINHGGVGTYTKNVNCWARNIDMSFLSVATTHGSGWLVERPGVLITPRHIRCANHYCPAHFKRDGYNDSLRFVTPDGFVRQVQVIGASNVVDPDLVVLTLSEDVTGCAIAKVAGDWMVQPVEGNDYRAYAGGLLFVVDKFRNIGINVFGDPFNTQDWFSPVGGTYPRHNNQHLPGPSMLTVHTYYNAGPVAPYADLGLFLNTGSSGCPWMALDGDGDVIVMAQALSSNFGILSSVKNANGTGNIHNTLIAEADANAIALGNMVSPTGYTVTVATDPTL
jgi:hypothetical protein